MKKYFNESQKLGDIVSLFNGAQTVFNQMKVDYCCGGARSLKEACKEDSDQVLEALNQTYLISLQEEKMESKDWREEPSDVLVDHILRYYHDYTKKALIEIDRSIFKILKVHFQHHEQELLQLHRLFGQLKIELEAHLIKEEENLFPFIEVYELTKDATVLSKIQEFVAETEKEHDIAGLILKEIAILTHDYTVPKNTCATFEGTYRKINELQENLFTHIYLENSVLFPRYHR